jgi:hypothetical protein
MTPLWRSVTLVTFSDPKPRAVAESWHFGKNLQFGAKPASDRASDKSKSKPANKLERIYKVNPPHIAIDFCPNLPYHNQSPISFWVPWDASPA